MTFPPRPAPFTGKLGHEACFPTPDFPLTQSSACTLGDAGETNLGRLIAGVEREMVARGDGEN